MDSFFLSESLNGGLANGGLRYLSAIVHDCLQLPSFCDENSLYKRPRKCIIAHDYAQIAGSGLKPPFESPHLDFPDFMQCNFLPRFWEGKWLQDSRECVWISSETLQPSWSLWWQRAGLVTMLLNKDNKNKFHSLLLNTSLARNMATYPCEAAQGSWQLRSDPINTLASRDPGLIGGMQAATSAVSRST